MDVDPSSFLPGLLHELNGLVEAALNIFSYMILEMEGEVLDSFVNMVVSTVVCSAIYHVADLVFLELLVVPGHDITSKIEEVIHHH